MTESDLIHHLQSGKINDEAYHWFWDQCYSYTCRLAKQHSIPIYDATTILTEAVGDTILKITNNEAIQKPKSFALGVVKNKMRNFKRDQKRNSYKDLSEITNLPSVYPDNSLDDDQLTLRKKLRLHLKQLPPTLQKLLYLYYYKELNNKQIAAVMNMTPGSAKSLKSRGLTRLKNCMPKVK